MCPPGRYLSCPLPVSSSSSWNPPPLPWQLVLPQPPDLPASGAYLLPLMMLVETERKSSKTHLWSQNLKGEVRGSEIHGHFQMHDKFKASLGHMRCCLKKKKKKDSKMNFWATISDHWGRCYEPGNPPKVSGWSFL